MVISNLMKKFKNVFPKQLQPYDHEQKWENCKFPSRF
jgi:hypothetical protein